MQVCSDNEEGTWLLAGKGGVSLMVRLNCVWIGNPQPYPALLGVKDSSLGLAPIRVTEAESSPQQGNKRRRGMKIEEAIERLTNHAIIAENHYNFALRDAQKLGIEALNRIKDIRHTIYSDLSSLLPGETK